MTGGDDLLGASIETPRRRGRPKGSTNKRAKDLQGFIGAKYGASAAQQSAALCMVTPAELKAAGGSMAKAQVAKALGLVEHVRQAQNGLDDQLRQVVKDALRELAAEMGDADARELKALVNGFLGRVKEATSGFGLVQALKLIADERAALLPYTDQKQPLAVTMDDKTRAPSVVVMGVSLENVQVLDGEFAEVSRPMSHGESEVVELPGLLDAPPAD